MQTLLSDPGFPTVELALWITCMIPFTATTDLWYFLIALLKVFSEEAEGVQILKALNISGL